MSTREFKKYEPREFKKYEPKPNYPMHLLTPAISYKELRAISANFGGCLPATHADFEKGSGDGWYFAICHDYPSGPRLYKIKNQSEPLQ